MKWKIKKGVLFGIVISVLLFLGLLIAVLANKLKLKTMTIILSSVWGFTILIFLVRALVHRLNQSKTPIFMGGLIPELDKERVLSALRRYYSMLTHIPTFVSEKKEEWIYPYGSFKLSGEDNYYAGREYYYILELIFEAGERRGQVWTIRVPAHQKYKDIANGNKVRADHCSIEEWKRNPREKPDTPLTDEKNIIFSNMLSNLDPDYRKSPELNRLIMDRLLQSSSLDIESTSNKSNEPESDSVLARENIYKKHFGRKKR